MRKKMTFEMQGRVDDMVSKYIEFYSERNNNKWFDLFGTWLKMFDNELSYKYLSTIKSSYSKIIKKRI